MGVTGKVSSSTIKFPEARKASLFLIFFRWIAFGVVFLFLYQKPEQAGFYYLNFHFLILLTFLYTIFISYFYIKGLQNFNIATKILVILDTLYCGFLIWLTGSLSSPFFLYAFSPILTAAFFFKITGGLIAASTVSIFYLTGLVVNNYSLGKIIENSKAGDLAVNILTFLLMGTLFAYPSSLLDRLLSTVNNLINKNDNLIDANKVLARTNRQLFALHKMSKTLQSALSLNEILDIVLTTITTQIGFDGAMLGLYDEENRVISNWIASTGYRKGTIGELESLEIPISEEGGLVAKSIINKKTYVVNPNGSSEKILPSHLENTHFVVLPLILKGHTVGVMLVDNHISKKPIPESEIPVLKLVAGLTTVTIVHAKLIIENQMLVVAEERNRIAREIHDGLAQCLFSIALNLQTCARKMSNDPLGTKERLVKLQKLASKSLKELRQYIYNLPSSNLDDIDFIAALKLHLDDVAKLHGLETDFSIVGRTRSLPPQVKECLYRIGQEALANVVKHAKASKAKVVLGFGRKNVSLKIEDNGRGFNGNKINGSMGINNMRQRVESLGGIFSLRSAKESGVCVNAKVPV